MLTLTAETPRIRVISLHHNDDVAVMAANGEAGDLCRLEAPDASSVFTLTSAVAFGHKVALRAIKRGEIVRKYGEPIGLATQDIAQGSHVHVHNLQSSRAGLHGEHGA